MHPVDIPWKDFAPRSHRPCLSARARWLDDRGADPRMSDLVMNLQPFSIDTTLGSVCVFSFG